MLVYRPAELQISMIVMLYQKKYLHRVLVPITNGAGAAAPAFGAKLVWDACVLGECEECRRLWPGLGATPFVLLA